MGQLVEHQLGLHPQGVTPYVRHHREESRRETTTDGNLRVRLPEGRLQDGHAHDMSTAKSIARSSWIFAEYDSSGIRADAARRSVGRALRVEHAGLGAE